MPRPRSLTGPRIADAALAVLDRDGAAALTMRAVAAELGMGTMSLYRYVTGREELEELVVERVLSAVDTGVPGGPWESRLAELAERVRAALLGHPGALPLMQARRHRAPSSHRWGEAVLGALTEAGFAGEDRVVAFRLFSGYVIGALQAEHLGPLAGEGTGALAALEGEGLPLLGETAACARSVPDAEAFRRGVRILLRGLAAEAAPER
ncbi:TetR/AcrR family transcriptional regulator C-terminal domain-containing protein [Nocardiopsis potens]|uniref:TetR/AcrR family transcriptional regulator C-terminal domain-containing protein n=1 Tax=Nocardiopsis potens TaxID=1246458 RepID=UPI000347C36A|nr:TetR/AcrR family transcriptional regulator C-terminal domain-containing protein [Nocardiopsis potens]